MLVVGPKAASVLAVGLIPPARPPIALCAADEPGCFLGCQYGSPNGGIYRFLLPDMEAEFGVKNPRRCKYAEMPYCACANLAPPPPFNFAPPPPMTFAEDYRATTPYREGQPTLGGADLVRDVDNGVASALVKRLVNARTLDLALRDSHRVVPCPGADDGESTCGRYCAAEHLSHLRAFTVTGAHVVASPPPPLPTTPIPDPPPLPPSAPFTECANTCRELVGELLRADDTTCRDGGKGAFLPTICEYSTQCADCGFRSNTRTIEQDDSCAHSNNGVCEDGGPGSAFVPESTHGYQDALTSLCGLGTDATDCAGRGDRLTQTIDGDSFQGVTNYTRPSPPPPPPPLPDPSPPPPVDFDPCTDTCRALFVVTRIDGYDSYSFDCSGTTAQILYKRNNGLCSNTEPLDAVELCSDGGFSAVALRWSGDALTNEPEQTTFACDYGKQCSACSRREGVATTDAECAAGRQLFDGGCRDACWVDGNGGVHHTEERFDSAATNADGTSNVDTRCQDGGPGSVSNKCPFGTQSTRCGPARAIAPQSVYHGGFVDCPVTATTCSGDRRLYQTGVDGAAQSRAVLGPPPPPPRPPPPSPSPNADVAAVLRGAGLTGVILDNLPPPSPPSPPPSQLPAADSTPVAPPGGTHRCVVTFTVKPPCAPSASGATGYSPLYFVCGVTCVIATVAAGTVARYTDFHRPLDSVLAGPEVAPEELVLVYE